LEKKSLPERAYFKSIGYGLDMLGLSAALARARGLDLLLAMAVNLGIAGAGVIFIGLLGRAVPQLAGWSGSELLYCWGMGEAVVSIQYAFFGGFFRLPEVIREGGLDRLLLKPGSPLLLLLAEGLSLEELPVLLLGLGLMLQSWPDSLILPLLMLGLACSCLSGLVLASAALAFFLPLRGGALGALMQLVMLGRYPLGILPRGLLVVGGILGWTCYYPAAFSLGKLEFVPWSIVVIPLSLGLGLLLWKAGLKRYQGS
jgi:ABC-type uncharacterized transport system permease subunit